MAYNLPLLNILRMGDEDFSSIGTCNPDVIRLREPTKIKPGQSFLFELCREISPDKEESMSFPWPRYIPVRAIARGEMAFVMEAIDQKRKINVAIKVPWPYAEHDEIIANKTITGDAPPPAAPKICSTTEEIKRAQKSFFKRLLPPSKKKTPPPAVTRTKDEIEEEKKRERELRKSSYYAAFERSYRFQEQKHRRCLAVDKTKQTLYVPACYDFGYFPKCYFTMELIQNAVTFLDYVRSHNDDENLFLFDRLLTGVKIIFHEAGLAHCDLTPGNILIQNNVPVVIDFGIAKGEGLPCITMDTTQKGTPGFVSRHQMENSKERGPEDDIFSLGRMMWAMLTRRQPPVNTVLATFDEHGKITYDYDYVQSLFDPNSIPEKFRDIFRKTWQDEYLTIEEFQRDYEEILYGKSRSTTCNEPCERLLNLEKIIKEMIKAWTE